MNLLELKLQQPNINRPEQKRQVYTSPIATTSLQRPDRPSSSLVKESVIDYPKNFVKDIAENLVNIKKAIKGESNDHDLGRINDFAMKAGALGLAGYLFTKARTPMTKTMEFVGFGAFFGAMALWPKLAITTPIKAMYGVDVQQKYKDNNGHTKKFFQDPQYIPWDLYTDEQISKMGDRLGVLKDIHNRNEVVKKKAQKIALQSNTLWMLTAGVATPVGCALMCNALENKVLAPLLEKKRIEKVEKALGDIEKTSAKAMEKYNPSRLHEFLNANKGAELSSDMVDYIVEQMSHDVDVLGPKALKKQVAQLLQDDNKAYVEGFLKKVSGILDKTLDEVQLKIVKEALEAEKKRILESFDPEKFSKLAFRADFKKRLVGILKANNVDDDDLASAIKQYNGFVAEAAKKADTKRVLRLSPEAVENIKMLDRTLYEFSAKKSVVDGYSRTYIGDVAESFATNRWNATTKKFFDVLGVSDKELAQARMTDTSAEELLLKKVEALVADDESYKKAIKAIQQEILKFDNTILPLTGEGKAQGVSAKLDESYCRLLDDTAEKLRAMHFDTVAERLVGNNRTQRGSMKSNLLDRNFRKIFDMRNGMYKMLHVLDFFKRAANGSAFESAYLQHSQSHGGVDLKATKDTLAKDLPKYKKIALSATIADYTTKFGYNNTQFGLYDRTMKMLYSTELAPATQEALEDVELGKTSFLKAFKKRIHDTLVHLGNATYPHADKVKVQGVPGNSGDILIKDSLVGSRLDSVFRETASGLYNSKKWLKMFGSTFGALVAVTLLAETMFGRINPQLIHTKKDKN